ncbi:sterol desaturase family protein [Sulfitobacter sp. S190]|uniref:sterol desaturase family protein n=1 Tax=Sulfitobacter sp. S190 TaxID=2867022 RepID=UPI0021A44D5F|nr:sterol desaturase family protein [Sulfitobacter sp. S190]UWR21014.1 sterol desaturase family protein [Sulfitobacter sp. S190]
METLDLAARIFTSNLLINAFLVPFTMCAIAYVFFKKRDEFSWHAIQNIVATLFVGGFNFGVALFLYNDINAFAQRAYNALSIPTLPETFWSSTPLWIVCIIGVMAKDFVDYWNHRWMHTKWGWPAHAAHHSDTHVNAFTAYRVHFLQTVIVTSSYILPLTWLQIPEAIPVVVVLSTVHNMYVHMDLEFDHGPFKLLLASPAFHRWHHADIPEAYGKNIANVMPLWDALFGTYYYPGLCKEEMGALKTGVHDKNPVMIYLYPFMEWGRMIRARLPRRRLDATADTPRMNTPAE